jgi:molecular chaperone DnaJ
VISKTNITNKGALGVLVNCKLILDPFGGGYGAYNANKGGNFKDFWEDLDSFFTGGEGEKSKKGRDIITNIEISFMEAINGCQKTVGFERTSVCSTCNGTKCKPGSAPIQCGTCAGSGKVFYKQGFMSIAMDCTSCNGQGNTIRNPCMTCHGKGFTNISNKENVNVPKGVSDAMNLRLQKKGHYSTNGQHGDLYVKIKVKPHPYFKREQFDIYTTNFITVTQAVLGAKIKIRTLYGEAVVNVDPGTNDGDTKKLINYGITKLAPNQNQKGNHFVKFKIVIPNKLNDQQKKVYDELSKVEDAVTQNTGD